MDDAPKQGGRAYSENMFNGHRGCSGRSKQASQHICQYGMHTGARSQLEYRISYASLKRGRSITDHPLERCAFQVKLLLFCYVVPFYHHPPSNIYHLRKLTGSLDSYHSFVHTDDYIIDHPFFFIFPALACNATDGLCSQRRNYFRRSTTAPRRRLATPQHRRRACRRTTRAVRLLEIKPRILISGC